MWQSALYLGTIRHRRSRDVRHDFEVPVWFALLDLDEITSIASSIPFLSHNGFNLLGFDDRDHMGFEHREVRTKLEDWLRGNGVDVELGKVQLLTQFRTLGRVFNPVSFYFCHDSDGALRFIIAEVNNTFGETYCYLLPADPERGVVRHRADKTFHVSPFHPVSGEYCFTVTPPDRSLVVHISLNRSGETALDATVHADRRPLTSRSLAATMVRYPLTGLLVLGRIHVHALKLWLKGAPFFAKPEPPPGSWRTRDGSVSVTTHHRPANRDSLLAGSRPVNGDIPGA